MCVSIPCVCRARLKEGMGSPGTGVVDGYEQPCGCGESNLSPLQERHLLLTTESSLQPHLFYLYVRVYVRVCSHACGERRRELQC